MTHTRPVPLAPHPWRPGDACQVVSGEDVEIHGLTGAVVYAVGEFVTVRLDKWPVFVDLTADDLIPV